MSKKVVENEEVVGDSLILKVYYVKVKDILCLTSGMEKRAHYANINFGMLGEIIVFSTRCNLKRMNSDYRKAV